MDNLLFYHYVYLPPITIGVDVTIEPLGVNKKFVERCVFLNKVYGGLDSMST